MKILLLEAEINDIKFKYFLYNTVHVLMRELEWGNNKSPKPIDMVESVKLQLNAGNIVLQDVEEVR